MRGGGRREAGGGRWWVRNTMSRGKGQVRFDRFDRRHDSMMVFAVGWLGMSCFMSMLRLRLCCVNNKKRRPPLTLSQTEVGSGVTCGRDL